MPIGDVTDLISHRAESHLVVRALTYLDAPKDALDTERLWSDAVLHELSVEHGIGEQNAGRKISLKNLMERRHAVSIVDGGAGPEVISVPFPHIAIVTDGDLSGATAAAQDLVDRISRTWGPFIDAEVGPRVEYFHGTLFESAMAIFFGYGIHLPCGRESEGRVQVRLLDPDPDKPPTAQFDLRLSNGASAGFYREQAGLVFSGDETRTAVSALELPTNVLFYIGNLPRRLPATRPQLLCRPLGRATSDKWEAETNTRAGEEWDGSFQIFRNGERFAAVDYMLDARRGRLWQKPPPGPALKLIGVAVPPQIDDRTVRRWWVDADEKGTLLASAAMPRRESLIVQKGRLKTYSWERYAVGRVPLGARADVRAKKRFGKEERDLLIARDGFGFLECGGRGTFVFDPALARGPTTSLLDWLARVLTLEMRDREMLSGLVLASRDSYVDFLGRADGVKLHCRGRGLCRPDGQGNFQEVGELELSRGGQAAIGPLIVEFQGA